MNSTYEVPITEPQFTILKSNKKNKKLDIMIKWENVWEQLKIKKLQKLQNKIWNNNNNIRNVLNQVVDELYDNKELMDYFIYNMIKVDQFHYDDYRVFIKTRIGSNINNIEQCKTCCEEEFEQPIIDDMYWDIARYYDKYDQTIFLRIESYYKNIDRHKLRNILVNNIMERKHFNDFPREIDRNTIEKQWVPISYYDCECFQTSICESFVIWIEQQQQNEKLNCF